MLRLLLIVGIAALLVPGASCATNGLPDEPVLKEYALAQKDFQLGSGLRVLVQEDHNAPLVVVSVVFRVGGAADPPGLEGLAHFVEHLAFRSHPFGGQQQLWDVLKRSGAEFNATTAADVTTYFAIAHKDRLAELLQLEAWRLTHTLAGVTEAVFEIEREVVRNELRERRETTIGSRTFDELLVQLFPRQHPLGHSMAGTHTSLSAAKLADAERFVATHYRPTNCTIVVAGDVNPTEVGTMLGQWPAEVLFGPGGAGGAKVAHAVLAATPAPPPPPPVSTALRRLKAPVAQPQLVIAWSAPGGLRGEDMLLNFAGAALNLSLFTGIDRKEKDDLLTASAGAVPLADGSVLLIQAELRRGADPEKARQRILDAVADTWSGGLSRMLVKGGKWGAATNVLLASGDPVLSALAAAQHLATTGKTAFYAETLQQLANLQPSAVEEFAFKYLKRERAVSLFFEPENEGSQNASPSRPSGAERPAHELGRTTEVDISGMGPSEIQKVARAPGLAALPRFQLSNGLEVVAVRRTAAPLAEIHLQIPGGDATVSPHGLASIADGVSDSRCRDHGSLLPVGGSLGGGTEELASRFSARVLSGNLVNAVAVMADEVSCREVDDEAFLYMDDRLKRRAELALERAKQPQVRAEKTFWATLYPGHPYGTRESDPQLLRRVKLADAESFVRSHFRPGGALAVVVADVPVEELRPMMEKYFAGWTGGVANQARPADPPPGPGKRVIHLFDRPQATQSSLQLGCRLASLTPEKLPAHDLLAAVATEKVWELRESWGATYGIRAQVADYPGGVAHLTLEGAVEASKTGAAVEKLFSLITSLASEGPDIKTFTLKRWDLARQYDSTFAAPAAVAEALMRTTRNAWPVDTWDLYPERLAHTSRSDLREVIGPCAGKEVLTIVGDAKVVKPQLEAAGLGGLLQP